MQLCVYAIAKNEAGFARRFMEWAGEADHVLIGDTGSDDGTGDAFRDFGAEVIDVRLPAWRFDDARNAVLEATPRDCEVLCSCDIE